MRLPWSRENREKPKRQRRRAPSPNGATSSAFSIHQATPDDAPVIAKLWASSATDEISKLQYGALSLEDKVSFFTRFVQNEMGNPRAPFFVLRDDARNGEAIAFAQWSLPGDSLWKQKEQARREERMLPEMGRAAKRAEAEHEWKKWHHSLNGALLARISDLKGMLYDDTLHGGSSFVLSLLHVDPSYEYQAAARRLARWSFREANQEGLVVYVDVLEGSKEEFLFRRMGFRRMIARTIPDLGAYGGLGALTYVSLIRFPITEQQDDAIYTK